MNLFRIHITISLLGIFVFLFAYIKQAIIAYYFGTSQIYSIYLISISIPEFILSVLAGGLSPLLISNLVSNKKIFNENFIYVMMLSLAVLCMISIIPTDFIYRLFGLTSSVYYKQANVFYYGYIFMIFLVLIDVYTSSYLISNKKYTFEKLSNILIPLSVIFLLLITKGRKIIYILIGLWLGHIISILFKAKKCFNKNNTIVSNISFKININKITLFIKEFFFLSGSVITLNLLWLTDRIFAGHIYSDRGVAALVYAERLNSIPYKILGLSIASILFPVIIDHLDKKNIIDLRKIVSRGIQFGFGTMLPIVITVLLFSHEIVYILFQRGKFDILSTKMVSILVSCYFFGVLFFPIAGIYARVMMAYREYKLLLKINFANFFINLIMNIIFVSMFDNKLYKLAALAISTSVVVFLQTIIAHIVSKKILSGLIFDKSNTIIMFKFVFAGIITGFISLYIKNYWLNYHIMDNILKLIYGISITIIIYLISLLLLRLPFNIFKLRI